mgnify:CR=1 FL=1
MTILDLGLDPESDPTTETPLTNEERIGYANIGAPCLRDDGSLRLRYLPFPPSPKQFGFLGSTCMELFFGGAGGGGKSYALLAAALQFVDVPGYAALILRRKLTDLTMPGALIDMSQQWLDEVPGAVFNKNERKWTFPSGAVVQFGYCNHIQDVGRYRGTEYHFIGWDELGEFPWEYPYTFLYSRLRRPGALTREEMIQSKGVSGDGLTLLDVPLRVRSASNPGGPGTVWVKRRFVDKDTAVAPFIPATFHDNPAINAEEYRAALAMLPDVERRRMELGDWTIQEIKGALWELKNISTHRSPWTRLDGTEMFERVYVGIDPAVGGGQEGSDECGIVAGGILPNGNVIVLVDGSLRAHPDVWAQAAVTLHHDLNGTGIVIEKNQGHELLRTQIRDAADQLGLPQPPVLLANAKGSKEFRAGTVAPAYRNPASHPKVVHSSDASLKDGELEGQMVAWVPGASKAESGVKSPDRVDGLVWCLRGLLWPSEIDDFSMTTDPVDDVVDRLRTWNRG